MGEALVQKFPALSAIGPLRHSFVLRQSGVQVNVDRDCALANLQPSFERAVTDLGFEPAQLATAEQVHGGRIAVVGASAGIAPPIPGVDGLIAQDPGVLLGIYVADCCAVYLADRRGRAVALVHSGKRGTELGIAPRAVAMLADLGAPPEDLLVQLSPCIRPPAYEVDFAARIRADCQSAGVPGEQIIDEQICTSGDLDCYYSYRVEKGKTGRMLALLGIASLQPPRS